MAKKFFTTAKTEFNDRPVWPATARADWEIKEWI